MVRMWNDSVIWESEKKSATYKQDKTFSYLHFEI